MKNLALYADHMADPFAGDTHAMPGGSLFAPPVDDWFTPAVAWMTIVQVQPGRFDAAQADFRALSWWDRATERGWSCRLLLENRRLRRTEDRAYRFDSSARSSG